MKVTSSSKRKSVTKAKAGSASDEETGTQNPDKKQHQGTWF